MNNRCYTYFRIVGKFNTDDISHILNLTPEKKWDIGDVRPNGSKYEVMLYPKAFRDIDDIYAYIAFEKLSPENAKGQTDRIWDAIRTLEQMPEAHQDRLVGRYAGKGYKQLIFTRKGSKKSYEL